MEVEEGVEVEEGAAAEEEQRRKSLPLLLLLLAPSSDILLEVRQCPSFIHFLPHSPCFHSLFHR